ncbi:MAG: response regulator [Oligoflexales bacterium]
MKVLMVDDEEDLLYVLGASFEGLGIEFETASNGEDALDRFGSFKPDIVLTDYNMPNMNGVELSKKLKEINKDIKIILYTAFDCVEKEDRGLFHTVLGKPLLSTEVIDAIKELID